MIFFKCKKTNQISEHYFSHSEFWAVLLSLKYHAFSWYRKNIILEQQQNLNNFKLIRTLKYVKFKLICRSKLSIKIQKNSMINSCCSKIDELISKIEASLKFKYFTLMTQKNQQNMKNFYFFKLILVIWVFKAFFLRK